MTSAGFGRRLVTDGGLVVAVAAIATGWARFAGAPTARTLRRAFDSFDPLLVLELLLGLAVVGLAVVLTGGRGRGLTRYVVGLGDVVRRMVRRMPTSAALSVTVSVVAVARISLGAANHTPKVLGDELVYTGLAKGWALHGEPFLRGSRNVGYSTLYPLFLAPAFRLATDGAQAVATARVLNAIAVALTAVPAYLFARLVVPRGWALGVAVLSVLVPWTAYAALTMTESLFYPAFVLFAAVLAWTLERPTRRRQAALLAMLATLVGIRAQALSLALGVVAAILLHGVLEQRFRAATRRFRPTLLVLALGLAGGLAAKAAGGALPTSSYNVVFGSFRSVGGMIEWGAWSLASFQLSVGVVVVAALPVAIRGMLAAGATPQARATAVVTVTTGLSLLGSVALLSASPYGLQVLHERSLFFVTPLLLTCFAYWLWQGLVRPWALAAVGAATVVVLAAVLAPRLALQSNVVDLPSANFFVALREQTQGISFRVWSIGLASVGAATFLLAKRPLFPVLSVLVAFAAVTAQTDYTDTLTNGQAHALSWVDDALPAGVEASLVYVDLHSGAPCAAATTAEQQDLTVWTEYFNTRIATVRNVYAQNARDFLASAPLTVGQGGLILDHGRPFRPRYAVLDSRQPIVGTRLARFDLATIHSQYQAGASLTLWRVDPPLRFYPRAQPLQPRADGGRC